MVGIEGTAVRVRHYVETFTTLGAVGAELRQANVHDHPCALTPPARNIAEETSDRRARSQRISRLSENGQVLSVLDELAVLVRC